MESIGDGLRMPAQPPMRMATKSMTDAPPHPSGGELCIHCGMCCDGTYHDRGRLRPGAEPQPLSFYKNENLREGDLFYFKMPCAHFDGKCCTIYESRYVACRGYRCKLLTRYEQGEVPLDQAKEVVAMAKSLIAEMSATDPQAHLTVERGRIRSELARDLKQTDEPQRASKSARLLKIVALDEFISRWFENNQTNAEQPK
jgi:hypothetical protein